MPLRLMRSVPWRRALLLLVLAEGPIAWSASAAYRQKQVLVLFATRRDAQLAVVADREMPRILGQGLHRGVDYYSEFLDSPRSSDPDYERAFRDFLLVKYRGHQFDLVVAMSDVMIEFVDRYRGDLFADTPVVFFANRGVRRRIPNSTGVIADVNLSDTVAFAAELQPDLRHVFIVAGSDAGDKTYEGIARRQLQGLEARFDMTYLSGLPTRALEARLASLPDRSMVYYLLVGRDGANEYFHPLEYVDRVAAVANAPTYCWTDSAMGHGILGGRLRNQQAGVEAVARLGLRVLHGEPADAIPLSSFSLSVGQVDWRQMQRWHIRAARVPSDAVVRFREPGLWERYQREVTGALALLLAQTALISALLVQRRTRRRAELETRASRAALSASYERIRALGGRLLNAQDFERARIARELHDDIGQELALLTIELERATSLDPDRSVLQDAASFDALVHAHRIAKDVHTLSHRLHPARLNLLGLVAALDGLCRETSRPGLSITFEHNAVPDGLAPEIVICLFRVAQEALQNAARHSAARQIAVELGTNKNLTLAVVDDGIGFDMDQKAAGLGLISMRERAEVIGGRLTIRTAPGAGTRVEVAVPETRQYTTSAQLSVVPVHSA